MIQQSYLLTCLPGMRLRVSSQLFEKLVQNIQELNLKFLAHLVVESLYICYLVLQGYPTRKLE